MINQGETSMGKQLTAEQILARKVGEEVVTFPDGTTVKVRGLTRSEANQMRIFEEEHEGDVIGLEALAISQGMVAPHLTPEQARAWLEADAHGEIQLVITAIQALSGQAPGQPKEYLKSVPRRR